MRMTITMILLAISIVGKAQVDKDLFKKKNREVIYNSLSNNTFFLKSAVNPNVFKPDSSVYYADSLENGRYTLITNKFEGDSIVMTSYWYDSDTINDSSREVHFMDNSLPHLPFEPIFSGGREGQANSYSYIYTSTIGDTLSKSYTYNFETNVWDISAKSKHNINTKGIDSLATSHIWDTNSDSWVLNNITKQEYIDEEFDTLKILMLAPNQLDTINFDVISHKYNNNGQIIFQQDSSYVWSTNFDSTVYDNNGLIDFIYHGGHGEGYVYAEEYFYDLEERLRKIYFWDKQGGQTDWVFDGCMNFYYPKQTSDIKQLTIVDAFNIYPNPCKDVLYIDKFSGKVEIYSSIGQLMIVGQLENGGLINTSSLRDGVYIVKFGDLYSSLITKR